MFEREEQLHLHQFGTLTDVEAELNQIRGESWNVERAHNEKQKQQAKAEKSARRMNKKKRGTSLNTSLFHIYFWQLKETQWNSWELEGTRGNPRELEGTQENSKEALVEVMEGKKLRKRGKEGKFHKS